jgi:hypothetical protein
MAFYLFQCNCYTWWISILDILQCVLDTGKHRPRKELSFLDNGTLTALTAGFSLKSSFELWFQWMPHLCFYPIPFPFLLTQLLIFFLLENHSPTFQPPTLEIVILLICLYYLDWFMGDH